jgi:hypothetical protein
MKTFQDYIDTDMIDWLKDNNLKYQKVNIKSDKGFLYLFFNDNYCLKIYDCMGHGFGVNINVADSYDESIYENDDFNLSWVFKYFNIKELASFYDCSEKQYLKNLPNLFIDIKKIIPQINQLTFKGWNDMKDWIDKEARRKYT